jgi:hypothetical protein
VRTEKIKKPHQSKIYGSGRRGMKHCLFCGKLEHETENENVCIFCKLSSGDYVADFSPKAFRRAYIKALIMEREDWITAIGKYQMILAGSPKSTRDQARDTAAKESLQEEFSAATYEDRKAFYIAWRDARCCADDCDLYCDQCSSAGIKFKPNPTYGLDADVRRFITKYNRYQTASELMTEEKRKSNVRNQKSKRRSASVLSGICDGKSDNESIWIGEQEGGGLFGQPEEVTSDQAERIEEMLSHPIGDEMVT